MWCTVHNSPQQGHCSAVSSCLTLNMPCISIRDLAKREITTSGGVIVVRGVQEQHFCGSIGTDRLQKGANMSSLPYQCRGRTGYIMLHQQNI